MDPNTLSPPISNRVQSPLAATMTNTDNARSIKHDNNFRGNCVVHCRLPAPPILPKSSHPTGWNKPHLSIQTLLQSIPFRPQLIPLPATLFVQTPPREALPTISFARPTELSAGVAQYDSLPRPGREGVFPSILEVTSIALADASWQASVKAEGVRILSPARGSLADGC